MESYLVVFFLLCASSAIDAACRTSCNCFLDDRGRNKVSCIQGGMNGSLEVSSIEPTTEVLEISAPLNNTNNLIIGPIFSEFAHLEELHITYSNIPEIGLYSFLQLSKLEVLNLRYNNISTVLYKSFLGLKKLKELYLDGNRIEQLTSGSFKNLTNLTKLSLAENHLKELVTRVFEKLNKLEDLNLSGNNFTALNPEAFIDIQDLRNLECRRCGLRNISTDVFDLIPNLNILDLGDNELYFIEDLTPLKNLVLLWLDGNNIHYIGEDAFVAQTQLKKLNLARNDLEQISSGAFDNMTSLMELDLSRTKLTKLEVATFEPFADTLLSLDIGHTLIPIDEFYNLLRYLRRLRHLGLAHLGLSELPLGLFDFNSDLFSLNLAHNRFVNFPIGALAPVPKLEDLNFSKNRLRGLDEASLQRLELIDVVQLDGNPWNCDLCHIVPMLMNMNKTFYLQGAVCERPYGLKGRKVGSLDLMELKKCSNNDLYYESNDNDLVHNYFVEEGRLGLVAVGAGVLLLVMTIFALLIGVCYSRRHAANYYTHEEKRNVEEDPMVENTDMLFGDNGELNFKFPLDKKISISTIDEIKLDPDLQVKNGT